MTRETPKMILFDYGHTLVYETEVSQIKGQRALMPYLSRNDHNRTVEEISAYAEELFLSLKPARSMNFELHNHNFNRYLYESLGIEFSISLEEAESIFWDHFAPGEAMPHAAEMLDYLSCQGIRTGIISNISFSGAALTRRLQRLFPRHRFEMVIASSEYVFRKPSRQIFQLAIAKSGLAPEELWYCGDSPYFDLKGATDAGIFPIWYCSGKDCHYRENNLQEQPACEHIRITDWNELTAIVKKRSRHEE